MKSQNYRSIEVNVIENQTEFLCHVYLYPFYSQSNSIKLQKKEKCSNLRKVCF